MTGLNHTLAGSIVAIIVPLPWAPFVALMSHFVLDALPHFGDNRRFYPWTQSLIGLLIIDGILSLLGLGFTLWLFPDNFVAILLCVAFSVAPDALYAIESRVAKLAPYFRFARVIQWGEYSWGWMLEIGYALFMSVGLYYLYVVV